MQTNVDKSHTNMDECRPAQRSHQTSVDECRQMQTSVDKSKKNFFDPKKGSTWGHFVDVAIVQQQVTSVCKFSILQFYLSLLITVVSFLSLAKPICILFHLMYVNLNCIDAQNTSQGKGKPNSPSKALRFIKQSSLLEVCVFRKRFNLNKIFANEA